MDASGGSSVFRLVAGRVAAEEMVEAMRGEEAKRRWVKGEGFKGLGLRVNP